MSLTQYIANAKTAVLNRKMSVYQVYS